MARDNYNLDIKVRADAKDVKKAQKDVAQFGGTLDRLKDANKSLAPLREALAGFGPIAGKIGTVGAMLYSLGSIAGTYKTLGDNAAKAGISVKSLLQLQRQLGEQGAEGLMGMLSGDSAKLQALDAQTVAKYQGAGVSASAGAGGPGELARAILASGKGKELGYQDEQLKALESVTVEYSNAATRLSEKWDGLKLDALEALEPTLATLQAVLAKMVSNPAATQAGAGIGYMVLQWLKPRLGGLAGGALGVAKGAAGAVASLPALAVGAVAVSAASIHPKGRKWMDDNLFEPTAEFWFGLFEDELDENRLGIGQKKRAQLDSRFANYSKSQKDYERSKLTPEQVYFQNFQERYNLTEEIKTLEQQYSQLQNYDSEIAVEILEKKQRANKQLDAIIKAQEEYERKQEESYRKDAERLNNLLTNNKSLLDAVLNKADKRPEGEKTKEKLDKALQDAEIFANQLTRDDIDKETREIFRQNAIMLIAQGQEMAGTLEGAGSYNYLGHGQATFFSDAMGRNTVIDAPEEKQVQILTKIEKAISEKLERLIQAAQYEQKQAASF